MTKNATVREAVSYGVILDSLEAASVTVTTSATALTASLSQRRQLLLRNTGSETIYLGPSDVTSSSGLPVAQNESLSLSIAADVTLYAITASGTADVRVLEAK